MQKQKKTTLTESQNAKLKKLLTPIVERIIGEVESPITKKFIPFSQQKPPVNKQLILISYDSEYSIGYYSAKDDLIVNVGNAFTKDKNVSLEMFSHWAV